MIKTTTINAYTTAERTRATAGWSEADGRLKVSKTHGIHAVRIFTQPALGGTGFKATTTIRLSKEDARLLIGALVQALDNTGETR